MESIILAGGSGTRLWPLSREYFPKHFLKFEELGELSLFQKTFQRALKVSKPEDIYIVTNEKQKFLIMGAIEELEISYPEKNIIIETDKKNTFPALCLAMKRVKDTALILPCDHHIKNEEIFFKALKKADELSSEYLITFGITPKTAHTGYGYIKHKGGVVDVFKEKPERELAEKYVKEGYLWNSGIFVFNKELFLEEIKKHAEEYYSLFFLSDDEKRAYDLIRAQSIDFGLLELSNKVGTVPVDLDWTDLGSFDSLHDTFPKDENKNSLLKKGTYMNSKNNFVTTNHEKEVYLLGVEDLIVIDTKDSLLICKRENSESIKDLVSELKKTNPESLSFHKTVYRPWGSFTILEDSKRHKVKRLKVYPGKILSLQRHKERSEHWTVVTGKAWVRIGEKEFELKTNESTYIPPHTIHRLENKSNEFLEIIETQSGSYLGEDDIERLEDVYGRTSETQ